MVTSIYIVVAFTQKAKSPTCTQKKKNMYFFLITTYFHMALSSNPLIHVGAFLWQSWSSHCSFSLLITFLVSLIMPFWLFMFILHTYYKTLISSWTKLIASLFPNSPLPSVLYILFRCNHSSRRWNALWVVFFFASCSIYFFCDFFPLFFIQIQQRLKIFEKVDFKVFHGNLRLAAEFLCFCWKIIAFDTEIAEEKY